MPSPWGQNPFAMANPWRQQPEGLIQPLSPEEEESVLGRVFHGALGGLGYIGSTLDKTFGGRAIRGGLGGNARELASIIPFSDTLGITDPTETVSGRDLLEKSGVLGKNEEGFDMGDVLGFGADVALDPASYLSFGGSAVNRLGKATQMAGLKLPRGGAGRAAGLGIDDATRVSEFLQTLPDTKLAELGFGDIARQAPDQLARSPLGGHVGVGLPWGDPVATFDLSDAMAGLSGAGKAIGNFALGAIPGGSLVKKGIEAAAPHVSTALDAGRRGLGALFDSTKMGEYNPYRQAWAARTSELLPEWTAKVQQREFDDLLRHADVLDDPGKASEFYSAAERGQAASPEIGALARAHEPFDQQVLQEGRAMGRDIKDLADYGEIKHVYRQKLGEVNEASGLDRWGIDRGKDNSRLEVLNNLDTNQVEKIAQDPRIAGPNASPDAAGIISREIFKVDDTELLNLRAQLKADPTLSYHGRGGPDPSWTRLQELEARKVQSRNLADMMKGRDPSQPYYQRNPIRVRYEKLNNHAGKMARDQAMYETIADAAKQGGDGVPVTRLLEDMGLTYQVGDQTGYMSSMLRALQKKARNKGGSAPANIVEMVHGPGSGPDITGWTVPKGMYDAFTATSRSFTTPEGLKPFLVFFDGVTNLTKSLQTTIWPAKHVRDITSAASQHYVHGGSYAGGDYLTPIVDSRKYVTTGDIPNIETIIPEYAHLNLSHEDAMRRFNAEFFGHDPSRSRQFQHKEVLGAVEDDRLSRIPGKERPGVIESVRERVGRGTWDPRDISGFTGRREDKFKPVAAGREVSAQTDETFRIATFLGKRSQGYSAAGAKQATDAAHYDFGNLTRFEKDVMKRMVPFYSWIRQNVPAMARELIEKPGGKVGLATSAMAQAQQDDGFVPGQLQKAAAIPVGDEKDGTQRYLSSFGLPVEDLFGMVDPRGTGYSLEGQLGNLNPLIKGPLEAVVGRQFYTGRDLSDVYSRTGNQPLDQLLMNSPFSRFVTTGLSTPLSDPRKGWGDWLLRTGSGVRLTDIDMEKARSLEARELLEGALKERPGVREFSRLYVRPEDVGQLGPQDLMLLRLQATLNQR